MNLHSKLKDSDDDNDDLKLFVGAKKNVNNNLNNDNNKLNFGLNNNLFANNLNKTSGNNHLNNAYNDKMNNVNKILEGQKEKYNNQNKGFGITSSIGFLNLNSSIGKPTLLSQPVKIETIGDRRSSNKVPENKISNINISDNNDRKTSLINNNRNFKELNTSINNSYLVKPGLNNNDNEDVEEIKESSLKENIDNKPNIIKSTNNATIVQDNKCSEVNKDVDNKESQAADIEIRKETNSIIDYNNDINKLNSSDPKFLLYANIMSKDITNQQDLKMFVLNPLPRKTVFRCNIVRKKDGLDKAFPKYYVYTYPNDKFLMAAKKMPKNKTPNYHVTLNSNDYFEKDSFSLGKLRSNFFGTEFNLFDNGINPKDKNDTSLWRSYICSIKYETNLFGLKGPRKMQVYLPGLTDNDQISLVKSSKNGDGLIEMNKTNPDNVITFKNKLPKWNEQYQAFVLDFDGRVEKGSVKNFQLCDPDNEEFIFLQFGRINENKFSMDFKFPFSPMQAFGICLSSLDSKFACD